MPDRLLGGLSPREFLRRHWQKRPLLVRAAWHPAPGLPRLAQLLALARRSEAESRLVLRRGSNWRVERGPIRRAQLQRLPARNWTLLLNGSDHHFPAAEKLLRSFDFLPRARLDDVMVSYAAPGGGVGPHCDAYDVFLLQARGRRIWRLQRPRRFEFEPEAPLKLISGFTPDEEYLVEPGDLLYLPPGWGHDGIALDRCWTYSVGCSAPSGAELALALLDYLHERGLPDANFRDPDLRPAGRPAEIGSSLMKFAHQVSRRIHWTGADVAHAMGRQLTTPKPQTVFAPPAQPLSAVSFRRQLGRRDVALDARTRLLYRGALFFVNGETVAVPVAMRARLARLADRRQVRGAAFARAGSAALLYDWYRSGYLRLERSA